MQNYRRLQDRRVHAGALRGGRRRRKDLALYRRLLPVRLRWRYYMESHLSMPDGWTMRVLQRLRLWWYPKMRSYPRVE